MERLSEKQLEEDAMDWRDAQREELKKKLNWLTEQMVILGQKRGFDFKENRSEKRGATKQTLIRSGGGDRLLSAEYPSLPPTVPQPTVGLAALEGARLGGDGILGCPYINHLHDGLEIMEREEKEPTNKQVRHVLFDIMPDIDFNTTTMVDILNQLGSHFGMKLKHRESEIKSLITEYVNSLSDDEEEDEIIDSNLEFENEYMPDEEQYVTDLPLSVTVKNLNSEVYSEIFYCNKPVINYIDPYADGFYDKIFGVGINYMDPNFSEYPFILFCNQNTVINDFNCKKIIGVESSEISKEIKDFYHASNVFDKTAEANLVHNNGCIMGGIGNIIVFDAWYDLIGKPCDRGN